MVLILLTSVSHAQVPKTLLSIKPGTHVYNGERVLFRCDTHGGGDADWTYIWYKNNETLFHNILYKNYRYRHRYDYGYGFGYGYKYDRFFSDFSDHAMREFIIWPVDESDSGNYTCRGQRHGSQMSEILRLTVSKRPKVVLSISPQSWLTEGDSVTLSCEVTDSSTGWTFSWYTEYREIKDSHGEIVSGDSYHISFTSFDHIGVYMCRAENRESSLRFLSNYQPVWINGESAPVSLIINPSRTQHFTGDSLLLSCEDQSNPTGWTIRQYIHNGVVSDCSSVTGSTCNISSLSPSYTGVYWCKSESGENSNPVNITVHGGDVILESPVHPVSEGHPLTLRCLFRNANTSNSQADFYKDGSVLQTQTKGKMIIYNVSKSDEGFYHCKHSERGESPKSWVSVRGPSGVEASFSVLMLICSVVTASPYLLVTIILLFKCYRARGHTDGNRIKNAVIEE